ncbi:MAG: C4-type zinc ribbon domain-containing protein [Thermodesulfobacteriota bacterium]|nr:C4-type zinc ribbon domain-containing protein [Thermodesulfobacteriota bacterium]
MKKLLDGLIELQKVELEAFTDAEALREIPHQIEEIDGIIHARGRNLEAINEEIEELNDRRVPLEAELKEDQALLDAADTRLKQIKTNKEYLALQREVDLSKKRKAVIEEQLIGIMDKIETRQADQERIKESFEEDRGILDDKKNEFETRQKELKARGKGFDKAAAKIRKTVDPALLRRYDRIRRNKKGLAVVACEDGVCQGCHMHIPPQLYNELVRGDRLISCPVCQRILYAEEKVDKE